MNDTYQPRVFSTNEGYIRQELAAARRRLEWFHEEHAYKVKGATEQIADMEYSLQLLVAAKVAQ